jgi:PTH1 family peptidyl-tRNA hydrolase
MKLIFALGNAEKRYDGTRHNVGFWVADELARKFGASYKEKAKFKCYLAEAMVQGQKVLIAKPTTYYNLVGESLQALMNFYDLSAEDVLVLHDDLMLPFGTLRIRTGGSGGGNNGIKSVNQHGGEDTLRLRIGIATELREQMGDTDFVLGKFGVSEREVLAKQLATIEQTVENFLNGELETTTHRA